MKTASKAPPSNTLAVNEIFGPTIQGEGPSMGRYAAFIRLSGCNLACSWCDTAYTWDWTKYDPAKETRRMSVDEVLKTLPAARLVVITGGEPMLQWHRGLAELIERLYCRQWVEVETNGTLPLPAYYDQPDQVRFNVSPKLAHSGDTDLARIRFPALRSYVEYPGARFKFVVKEPQDADQIHLLATHLDIAPSRIWIMPEMANLRHGERMAMAADMAIANGWNLSDRLHIQIWGGERGR